MRVLCAAVFLICLIQNTIVAAPNSYDDGSFKRYIQGILSNFKEVMKTGLPELKIPVLDPLVIDDINVVKNDKNVEATLKIKDLSITGLSGFEVPQLDASLKDMRLSFTLDIPSIMAHSNQYDLNGKIIRLFPLTGNGKMSLQVDKISIKINTTLALNADTSLRIDDLKADLNFESANLTLENFLGGGSFGKIVSQLISSLGKVVFEKFKPKIMITLEDALRKAANKQLAKVKISDFIKGSTGKRSIEYGGDIMSNHINVAKIRYLNEVDWIH